jgi:hypothetical protein
MATMQRPPDLAKVAREAVVHFLHEEADAPAEPADGAPEAGPPPAGLLQEAPLPQAPPPDELAGTAERMIEQATRAAAVSVSALDRVEAAAAKLEADIADARRTQADLQARAGTAAERAVRAAEAAYRSAGTAEAASNRALQTAKRVGRYAAIALVLVLLQFAIAVIFAVSSH